MGPGFSYEAAPLRFFRVLVAVVFGAMALIGAPPLVWSLATHSGPPAWFALAWLGILAWNIYWWVFGLVVSMRVVGESLEWRGFVRTGSLRVGDIVRLRPGGLGSGIEVVEVADGTRLSVWVRRGFSEFCDALRELRPEIEVRVGWQGRLAERLAPTWYSEAGFHRDL